MLSIQWRTAVIQLIKIITFILYTLIVITHTYCLYIYRFLLPIQSKLVIILQIINVSVRLKKNNTTDTYFNTSSNWWYCHKLILWIPKNSKYFCVTWVVRILGWYWLLFRIGIKKITIVEIRFCDIFGTKIC